MWQSDLPLGEFAAAGWYIDQLSGDRCPHCVRTYGPGPNPHRGLIPAGAR